MEEWITSVMSDYGYKLCVSYQCIPMSSIPLLL